MDTIAYTQGYLAHEEMDGIEYDFPELDWLTFGNHLVGSVGLSLLTATIVAGILTSASPASAQMMTRGMRGNNVAEVQTLLRNRGYPIRYGANGSGRGIFGPNTENAVRDFQQKMGLTPDGIVGSRTLAALRNGGTSRVRVANANTRGGTGGRSLQLGARGNGVAELQTLLRNRGYAIRYGANGAGRGVFGPQTENALRRFQRDARISVDGVAGPQTLNVLRGGTVTASRNSVRQANNNTVRQARFNTNGRFRVATGGSRLNIRSSPSVNAGVVGTLTNGATVNVIGRSGSGWAQIGAGQYIASRYIRR